ncbi:MAG: hypothetical protein QM831_43720 [Kofleriaceae bacterium]
MRYAQRLIPGGSAPSNAFVERLVSDQIDVAWMIERDGTFVHVLKTEVEDLETMRGYAMVTMLDGELANETLDHLPGVNIATNGAYAAELLLDHDHLTELHRIIGGKAYLAGVPRRGRFLVGGIGAGVDGMRAFVEHVRREYAEAPAAEQISPAAMFVRDGAPKNVIGELELAALASRLR